MGSLFLIKLATMPVVIIAVTLAGRRYGPAAAGLILGLPIVSGPVSVFIAIEQGIDFARAAASGTLLGLVPLAAYCFTYAHAARRFDWPVALPLALAATAACVWLLDTLVLPEAAVLWLTAAVIATAIVFCPNPGPAIRRAPAPWWDLSARVLVGTAVVLTITVLAESLGPKMTGMASTFPVMLTVMAPFTHSVEGRAATVALLRGCIEGLVTFALFFQVLRLTLGHWPSLPAYLTALAASLALAGVVLALQRRRSSATAR